MKLRAFRFTSQAIPVLLCSNALWLLAQIQPVPRPQAQQTLPITAGDPTRPEVQPRLDVDRDPIPSPDPIAAPEVDNTVINTASPSATAKTADLQSQVQKKKEGSYILHADVDEVLLSCTVLDDKGRPVTDLSKSNFRVWEDGVAQTVNSVIRQDLPVSMGVLVDNSGSMRDKRAPVNTAAYNLLKMSNPADEAFVVNFSDRAILDQGFTTDRVALNRGLSRFDSKGTTALYDAVAAAADELAKHAKHRKQVLLIITDGADNASRLALEQAVRRVRDLGGPVVYSIGLLFDAEPAEADHARSALETLSQETGGVSYFPQSLRDVDSVAAQVAHDIREQYTVDYHSSKPARLGGYRTIRVEAEAPNRGKLSVRTRRGYYAQAVDHPQTVEEAQQ